MKGTALLLLCAITLAQAEQPLLTLSGKVCHCNPGEANSICSQNGSENEIIAHENCNQFYKCANGLPIAFYCPGQTLYNPLAETCDWPQNVQCGGRPIVAPDAENEVEEDSDEDDGENGSTCNCNPAEAPALCAASGSNSVYVAHENCNQFYQCANGSPVTMNCPQGLLYNPYNEQCDWPANVDCGDRPIVDIDLGGNNGEDEDCEDVDDGSDNAVTCNCDPAEAPKICSTIGSDGVLVAHENCNQFYQCVHGVNVAVSCPSNLLYNPYNQQCDWPQNVDCGDRVIDDCNCDDSTGGEDCDDNGNGSGSSGESSDNGGTDSGLDNESSDTDNEDSGSDNGSTDNGGGTCNCNPGEAPEICAALGSDDILVAHEYCNQFYKCDNGVNVALFCPDNLLYNPYTEQCDWPQNVECGDRPIVEIDGGGEDNGDSDNGGCDLDGGGTDNGGTDNGGTDNGGADNGGTDNGGGTCNCNPGEAPGICGQDGSDGILIAHENCNKFYMCSNGEPVALFCPGILLYNPYTEQCDWPQNVECGDRPIIEIDESSEDSDNGDNGGTDNGGTDNGGGTCNCNPGEAPGICGQDGSDGILIAHENCNKFYKCSNGEPVALFCPGILLYNPYTEQCDWPQNVECGDRPIIEIDESSEDSDNGDNGGTDNGGTDNGGGTCNCNPGEAPGICGQDGSDGILIAHENCNKFYMCSNGEPVALFCPGILLYNPYTEQCDWPQNVECGDRPIIEIDESSEDSDNGDNGGTDNGGTDNGGGTCNCNPGEAPGICGQDGSDGILIAHENCNKFYMCSNGEPVALFCPGILLYNPYTEQCDWPQNVECGDRPIVEVDESGEDNGDGDNGGTDNGGGACNCNPGEAPQICGAGGSDGVLVAHENCNQFYKCDNGVNVALFCPDNLLYNPYTEQCDWPQNVICGDRPIVEIDGGSGDNGSEDSDCEDNTDNGGGTCNCNPDEADGICAADGSDGILIAHENCNQFYKCANGVPEGLFCPGILLYNPYTQQCDWPQNVDCGEKPIVEIDEEDSENNSESDNDSSDDNSNNNNNSAASEEECDGNSTDSTCNCNPDNAPGICATAGSEGSFVAHENCNQFYQCAQGVPVPIFCPAGLLYNIYLQRCDWPSTVDCVNRPIVENDGGDEEDIDDGDDSDTDSDGGASCNCNPDDAPSICSATGSDSTLIAHHNCNQFYQCAQGVPVSIFCANGLLYNPYTARCDWPSAVDCGDRPIVEVEQVPDEDEDNEDGAIEGECDPSQAPTICEAAGSDGVLVAHENCNQFYVCMHGVPVAASCPSNLLYNPNIRNCDWPSNVDCGDRVVPDAGGNDGPCACDSRQAPSICAGEDSNGKLIAHESCSQYYMCLEGAPVARSCPASLFYDPHTEQCLWPAAVSCEGREVASISYYSSLNKHVQARRGLF